MAKTKRPARPSPSRLRTPPPARPARRRASRATLRRVARMLGAALAIIVVLTGLRSALRPGPPDIDAEHPIASYRIVYRVHPVSGPETREERIAVRPYLGSDISRDSTGKVTSGQLHNDEGVFQYRTAEDPAATGWVKLLDKRHLSPSDFRSVPVVRDQLRHGQVRKLGTRQILGRTCSLVRMGGPLGATDGFKRPTAQEHADVCIDRTGIALRERWVLKGKVARESEAVEFAPTYRPGSETFTPQPRLPDPPAGALRQVVVDLDASSRKTFSAQLKPFDGFVADGGIVEVSLGAFGASGGTATERFRHGFDLIELSQHPNAPQRHPGDRTMTVAPWGEVRFRPDAYASSYEVPLGDNQWARLRSPNLTALRRALDHLERVKPAAG